MWVALRKESVDRNKAGDLIGTQGQTSLSARRAWIEIMAASIKIQVSESLSARRAWIEITAGNTVVSSPVGRSPQGERG